MVEISDFSRESFGNDPHKEPDPNNSNRRSKFSTLQRALQKYSRSPLIHTFIDMHVKLESLLAYPEIHSLNDFKKTLNFTICFYGQERKPRSEATK